MKTSGESRMEWKGHMSGRWETDAAESSSFDKSMEGGRG